MLIRTVMELDKIESILDKYFQGETTIAEENALKKYFSSSNVAQHLKQYQPLFGYFSQVKKQKTTQKMLLKTRKKNKIWLSIAAAIIVLLGIGIYFFVDQNTPSPIVQASELGTYNNPQEAFAATQKALSLLSNNVNVGIESVQYIEEYEQSKNKIFKQ